MAKQPIEVVVYDFTFYDSALPQRPFMNKPETEQEPVRANVSRVGPRVETAQRQFRKNECHQRS